MIGFKYILAAFSFFMFSVGASASCAENPAGHGYVDFSSDRSTWFFRTDGGNNDTVFCDFFFPFDPTARIEVYDPLIRYTLDTSYYFGPDNELMINLGDLKKLYAPYFDFQIRGEVLSIRHTVYDKLLLSGAGKRSTSIEYTKKVWCFRIDLNSGKLGFLDYAEYEPVKGGRNKPAVFNSNIRNSYKNKEIGFKNEAVQTRENGCFVSLAEIMKHLGKVVFENKGYLHIQSENMADVTKEVDRPDTGKIRREVTVPNAGNPWHGAAMDAVDQNYVWADYMNDVADGERKTGWLWGSFYIPSGENFVDADGNETTLTADRIVPYNIYVPSTYDKDASRLLFMLHGGTGNENTSTYRIMLRDVPIEQYAETYNYILVSPNGWTQNPMWREGQALYSFMKSAESALSRYPVNKNRVFITGNSLGGKGTLEIAMRHPEMFRAMAPTAMKITDRAGNDKKVINIEGTGYRLKDISNMPAFIAQGTADRVTSYKTQIGNKVSAGSIVKAVMPNLDNALYLAVEGGDHSYSFGAVLTPMFEFFENTLRPYKENSDFDTLYLSGNSTTAYLDDEKIELSGIVSTDGTVLIPLEDLEAIYGERLKIYKISVKNKKAEKTEPYYTVTYDNTSINLSVDNAMYRKNMERYGEDGNVRPKRDKTRSGNVQAQPEPLDPAPRFSTCPFEMSGKIYVPVRELMAEFGRKVVIRSF
jgi:S-formylglutathione hydrolase FrmB